MTHSTEVAHLIVIMEHAEPLWLLAAILFQIGTYVCAGTIWRQVTRSSGYRLPVRALARLSVEQLTVNQLVPTGGVAGNFVVVRSIRRLGVPAPVAMESILIDSLGFNAAYAVMAAITFSLLWLRHDVTSILLALLSIFALMMASLPIGIWWLLEHRAWKPPDWLKRYRFVASILDSVSHVSAKRVRSPLLLTQAGLLHTAIFFLDVATLWAVMLAVGTNVSFVTAFVAYILASIAGTISLIPSGIGTFEAGSTATMALLGVPVEAALTGTLLLRALTLWFPLIPGLFLAKQDLGFGKRQTKK